jgi:UDP-glucose 4-epimerase
MKVLVTGGAGYIGSCVAAQLLEAGHQVQVLDDLSNGHLQAVPVGAEFIQGDVGDRYLLQACLKGTDAVMHFAAFIEVGESMRLPLKHFQNNSAKALTLLQACVDHSVQRFVFSSTAALFGNPLQVPIDESHPLQPTSAYGESKHLVERSLRWVQQIHGLHYASLRYFNAAGATTERGEDHHPESHLIPIVLEAARGVRPHVQIFGTDYPTRDGTCVRDYVHIEDLASAHLLALEALAEQPRLIYNLGNGEGFSVKEVIAVARAVTGQPIAVVEQPRRAGDPAELVASSQKIRQELGWRPRYPELGQIIQSAWDWRQRNPEGYGRG